MALELLYNFNNNIDVTDGTPTIQDYSINGNTGASTSITIQDNVIDAGDPIPAVGKDAVFSANTDLINAGNFTGLDGLILAAIHLRTKINSAGSGTLKIASISGVFDIEYNHATKTINASLVVASGTASVSFAMVEDNYFDIGLTWASNVLTLYLTSAGSSPQNTATAVDTDSGQTGAIAAAGANVLYLGYDGSNNGALMALNEFKILSNSLTALNVQALIDQRNGVTVNASLKHALNEGDLIGSNIALASASFAVVTYVSTEYIYKLQPVSGEINQGVNMSKVGHIWDQDEDDFLYFSESEICFFDSVNTVAEVLNAANKVLCINKGGVKNPFVVKSANYTATVNDHTIEVTAACTITLPSTIELAKDFLIINNISGGGTVTISGNGNNINSTTDIKLLSRFDSAQIKGLTSVYVVK